MLQRNLSVATTFAAYMLLILFLLLYVLVVFAIVAAPVNLYIYVCESLHDLNTRYLDG